MTIPPTRTAPLPSGAARSPVSATEPGNPPQSPARPATGRQGAAS